MIDKSSPIDTDDTKREERAQQAAADVLAKAGKDYGRQIKEMVARSNLPSRRSASRTR